MQQIYEVKESVDDINDKIGYLEELLKAVLSK